MGHVYLSTTSWDGTTLIIAPLTRRLAIEAGLEPSDAAGYWLMEREREPGQHTELLARIPDESAALRIAALLNLT